MYRPPLHFGVVAIEMGAFESPSTKVANFTFTYGLYAIKKRHQFLNKNEQAILFFNWGDFEDIKLVKIFGMTRPGIEPQSPGPLANTLLIRLTTR